MMLVFILTRGQREVLEWPERRIRFLMRLLSYTMESRQAIVNKMCLST